jgi:GPH family glycoside/pentoside/hexuronide:cation symporter
VNDIFGHWLYANLSKQVFNMYLGLSPILIGNVLMIARLVDAFTDPLSGWLSDNTRTRWGRRRPYILFGSVAAGIALPCLFLVSRQWDVSAVWYHNKLFWFMLVSAILYAPIISLYNMPYASLGNELTPDYHERTSVMAFKAIIQKISGIYLAASWMIANLPIFNDPATGKPNVLDGARWACLIAGVVMILAGVANFVFVRERYYTRVQKQEKIGFWETCRETFSCRPFLVLLAIVGIYAIPTAMVNDLGLYSGTYYVFHGDQARMSVYNFWGSWGYFGCGVVGVFVASWISRHFGKRKALLFTLSTGILTFGSSWWMYTPAYPWLVVLNTSLTGFSATGFWVVLPSMSVDVIDYDETRSGKRREGSFSSWFSWVTKAGMALSMGAGGYLLALTGFNAALGGNQTPGAIWWMRFLFAVIPVAAFLTAMFLLGFYPLTQERVHALRLELEARRGKV